MAPGLQVDAGVDLPDSHKHGMVVLELPNKGLLVDKEYLMLAVLEEAEQVRPEHQRQAEAMVVTVFLH
jgi:hypothetical protein